jgi:hypothetical protein
MYTLTMSLPSRLLVLGVLVSLGVAPQLACFMPDQPVTPPDMDCCKEMIGACTGPNMSHQCCQTVAPLDLGLTAKTFRHMMPHLEFASTLIEIAPHSFFGSDGQSSKRTDNAPPDKQSQSSLVLRI